MDFPNNMRGYRPTLRANSLRRPSLRMLLAFSVASILTLMLWLLQANSTTSAIVYLVAIVWFATLTGPSLSIYMAILSAGAFDYFFLEPRYSITIAGFQDWLAMIAFVAACIVVGRVAERARRQTRNADQRREDVERLYALSQEMMLHEDAEGLIREIPRLVEHNFALEAVLLYVRDEDQLHASVPGGLGPEAAAPLLQKLSAATAAHQPTVEPSAGPEPASGAPSIPEASTELPEDYLSLNLVFGMNSVGTLAWKPAKLSREVAASIAAQVAIAITRSHAIEASTRLEAARAADRLRAALVDSVTHELRTPLTAIRAAASTLAAGGETLDSELQTELVAILDEESARLDVLIGEAVEMAEIDAEAIRVKSEPLHTLAVLEQAVESARAQLMGHRVSVSVEQPDNPVWFDGHLITRVLRHLLENAARYTPTGSQIHLESHRADGRLEFIVADNGKGIDPHDLPLIFEKFYRGKYRITSAKGSGMGLAIARAILAAHGGEIAVQSTVGQGTTFRLWIPLVERSPGNQ